MQRLRSEYAVYGTDTGRICVVALNEGNIAATRKEADQPS